MANPADSGQKIAILHKRNFIETFHKPFKNFIVDVSPKDTLIIMSKGYKSQMLSGKFIIDNAGKLFEINMVPMKIELRPVTIKPMIPFDTLAKRSRQIGQVPSEFRPTFPDINPLSSPLTAIWAQFNSLERQKRKIAELIAEKDIHDIMVAYLDICNKQDIINLPKEDYDDFIRFARFTPETLRYNTQYDVLNTIRYLYIQYNVIKRNRQ